MGNKTLPANATIADFQILHDGNHNELNNPHSQYLLNSKVPEYIYKEYLMINSVGSIDKWSKLQSITINANQGYYSGYNVVLSGYVPDVSVATMQKALFWYRVKQITLGGTPIVEIKIIDSDLITKEDIALVVTQNDTSKLIVELYAKVKAKYDVIHAKPIFIHTKDSTYTFYENQTMLDTLPSGTVYNATYQDVNEIKFKAITSTNAENNSLFIDSADNKLKFKDNTGLVKIVTLT